MESFPKSGILVRLIHLTLCFFGVRWSTRLVRIHFLLVCGWLCWYAAVWYWAIQSNPFSRICTMECMIAYGLFLFMTFTHIIIMIDTFLHREKDSQLLLELNEQLTSYLQRRFNLYMAGVFLVNVTVRSILVWNWVKSGDVVYFPLFYITLSSSLGMQLTLTTFLCDIMITNERVTGLRQSVKLLTRQRQPEIMDVVQLKQRYSHLAKQFMQLNVKYGGCLILIFIDLFFEFIYNAYLVLMNILIWSNGVQTTIHHFCFMSYIGLLMMLSCWHCQQSYNLSRQIGCLIWKLVKPLGSKQYNDLVSEFSLQTLHQPFIVTARNFFNLNLQLVSNMFAAVVTYLVILIQFMFAEMGSQMSRLERN